MNRLPWAKLTTRVTPKITVSPAAVRNRVTDPARPVRNWMVMKVIRWWRGWLFRTSPRRPHRPYLGVRRQIGRAVGIAPRRDHPLAVLQRRLADEGAKRSLVIQGAIG